MTLSTESELDTDTTVKESLCSQEKCDLCELYTVYNVKLQGESKKAISSRVEKLVNILSRCSEQTLVVCILSCWG